MSKVLVISRRFPAINQPWIDTYLEQLLRNGHDFLIYSYNKEPEKYHHKVDTLGLKKHQIKFTLAYKKQFLRLLCDCFKNPITVIQRLITLHPDAKALSHSLYRYFLSLLKLYYLDTIFKNESLSVCHSHTELGAIDFVYLTRAKKIPLVITFHGLPPSGVNQVDDWKRDLIYREAKVVFVNTEFAKRQVMSIGCPEHKVTILPQGIPLEDFPFAKVRNEPDHGLELLTVGRFHRDKGQHYGLLAIARLKRDGIHVKWHFVGVGQGIERLKKLAERLNITENIIFHVALDDKELRQLYRTCHIFVLTSIDNTAHIETQSVVLQEAQASGALVIATQVGGVPECITHAVNALLIKPASSRDIHTAIIALLNRKEEWAKIRKTARMHVENHFSADNIGKKMSSYLKSITEPTLN